MRISKPVGPIFRIRTVAGVGLFVLSGVATTMGSTNVWRKVTRLHREFTLSSPTSRRAGATVLEPVLVAVVLPSGPVIATGAWRLSGLALTLATEAVADLVGVVLPSLVGA